MTVSGLIWRLGNARTPAISAELRVFDTRLLSPRCVRMSDVIPAIHAANNGDFFAKHYQGKPKTLGNCSACCVMCVNVFVCVFACVCVSVCLCVSALRYEYFCISSCIIPLRNDPGNSGHHGGQLLLCRTAGSTMHPTEPHLPPLPPVPPVVRTSIPTPGSRRSGAAPVSRRLVAASSSKKFYPTFLFRPTVRGREWGGGRDR